MRDGHRREGAITPQRRPIPHINPPCAAGWISYSRTSPIPPPPPPPDPNGPVNPAYNDSGWRLLNLPHDYIVEQAFTPTADRGHGYLPRNISWYRKHFAVDPSWEGSVIWVDLDGVYRDADVYLNGAFVAHHTEGYTSWRVYVHNVTNASLIYSGNPDNVLAMRVDGTQAEGWFYEPAGLFRHSWLNAATNTSIVPWGVYAPTYVVDPITSPNGNLGPQTASLGVVNVATDVANADPAGAANSTFDVVSTLYDAAGNVAASARTPVSLAAGGFARISQTLNVPNASLWNTVTPYLYTLVSSLVDGGNAVFDGYNTSVGIRRAIFDASTGFMLNGYPQKLRGTSNHIDFGGCGGAVPERVNAFRVRTLQSIGGNAWRTAHNPINPEHLDAMDRLGMLVWDENRFINDGVQPLARSRKTPARRAGDDAAVAAQPPVIDPQLLLDFQSMVLRDRNHPSVVIWSLCNEGGCQQNSPVGNVYSSSFKAAGFACDTTRPITGNSEFSPADTFTQCLDVQVRVRAA